MNDSVQSTGADSGEAREGFDPRIRTRNRLILVGILVLAMLPLAAAVGLYYGNPEAVTGAQTNSGALLTPPAQLSDLGLQDQRGLVTAEGPRKWRLVMFLSGACDQVCLEQMHQLRQLQVLLGRDQGRVIRLTALDALPDAETRSGIANFFPDLELVSAAPGTLGRVLAGRELVGGVALPTGSAAEGAVLPESGILVVDPLGNVIFFHGLNQIGEPLLFDLKRLLRLSNIG